MSLVLRLAAIVGASLALSSLGAAAPPRLPLLPCTLPGGVDARCGTFVVSENRAKPDGRTIALRVAVVRGRDGGTQRDALVHITGGPGGSAIADAVGMLSVIPSVLESRDLVLVDQRGTGGSNRLECPPPRSNIDVRNASSVRAYMSACMAGLDADPRQYTTVPAMDDLAEVLTALGYTQVNVFGGSYGATAVQYLLAQHPELVRTAILDGATLLDVPIFELWGRNGQRALRSIVERCAAAKRCAARYPRVRREVFDVIAALRRKPVRTRGLVIDAPTAADTIQSLSRSPASAAQIPWLAHRARVRDWGPLARAVRRVRAGAGTPQVMYWSIVCNEPWARRSPARSAAASRGTYLAELTAMESRVTAAACSVVPRAEQPAWSNARVLSAKPVLFVVGGADPQDPVSNVAGAIRELPNSLIVVVPGGGHGSVQLGCMPLIAQRFIERGTATGLDTGCIRRYRPPAFLLR
jgi:pimeloyl-ACP methyl ester carboxylesterase